MECIVYYTQLSFLRMGSPSPEALSILKYTPGSAFFAIEILGYFVMSLSVLCLGLTITDGLLRKLFVGMGIWGGTCIVVPLLPFMYESDSSSSADAFGFTASFLWAVLFFPLMIMLARYYYALTASSCKID